MAHPLRRTGTASEGNVGRGHEHGQTPAANFGFARASHQTRAAIGPVAIATDAAEFGEPIAQRVGHR